MTQRPVRTTEARKVADAHHPTPDDDPWTADTLEWATSSPPPAYNFARIPVVHSARPLKEDVAH